MHLGEPHHAYNFSYEFTQIYLAKKPNLIFANFGQSIY